MPQIAVLYPEHERQEMQFSEAGLLIGRDPLCDLQINDEFVSSRHCRIYPENGEVFIEDLGSTNGTFIDGTQIEKKSFIRPGQRVQIGISELKLLSS